MVGINTGMGRGMGRGKRGEGPPESA